MKNHTASCGFVWLRHRRILNMAAKPLKESIMNTNRETYSLYNYDSHRLLARVATKERARTLAKNLATAFGITVIIGETDCISTVTVR